MEFSLKISSCSAFLFITLHFSLYHTSVCLGHFTFNASAFLVRFVAEEVVYQVSRV